MNQYFNLINNAIILSSAEHFSIFQLIKKMQLSGGRCAEHTFKPVFPHAGGHCKP